MLYFEAYGVYLFSRLISWHNFLSNIFLEHSYIKCLFPTSSKSMWNETKFLLHEQLLNLVRLLTFYPNVDIWYLDFDCRCICTYPKIRKRKVFLLPLIHLKNRQYIYEGVKHINLYSINLRSWYFDEFYGK